jgi:hypothetical protein
MDALKSS